jgi:hypothetical protein
VLSFSNQFVMNIGIYLILLEVTMWNDNQNTFMVMVFKILTTDDRFLLRSLSFNNCS